MNFLEISEFDGIKIFEREIHNSEIGYFSNLHKLHDLDMKFVQDSISFSKKRGTIRGMHFQREPFEQAKLVTCLQGGIEDYFIDLRSDSKTFGKYGKIAITQENYKTIFIPRGFAHGFITTSDSTLVFYKLDNNYHPESEETIAWDDTDLSLIWPDMEIYSLSSKDLLGKSWKDIKGILKHDV